MRFTFTLLFVLLCVSYVKSQTANLYASCQLVSVGATGVSTSVFIGPDAVQDGNTAFIFLQISSGANQTVVLHNTGDLDATLSSSTVYGVDGNFVCTTAGYLGSVKNDSKTLSKQIPLTGENSIVGKILAIYENAAPCGESGDIYSGLGNLLGKCVVAYGNTNSLQATQPPAGNLTTTTDPTTVINAAVSQSPSAQYVTCNLQATAKYPQTSGYTTFSGKLQIKVDGTSKVITAKVSGLSPSTIHGLHIHAFGDLSNENGLSVGGHWKNSTQTHALPPTNTREYGDLGNICAYDNDGNAYFQVTTDYFPFTSVENVIGRGIALHANRDDGTTTSFGDRIAFCTLGYVPAGSTPAHLITIPTNIDFSTEPVCATATLPASTSTTTTSTTTTTATSLDDSSSSSSFLKYTTYLTLSLIAVSFLL